MTKMDHLLPPLPYAMDALEPHLSAESLQFHYGKHHQNYVTNLNRLIHKTEFHDMSLEEIVRRSSGAIFNNAAQTWNHNFFWNSMTPNGGGAPEGALLLAIERQFGSMAGFRKEFTERAAGNFGAGWTWLVRNRSETVSIVNTSNAATPLVSAYRPLLTVDVWEHAYYIDYRNSRKHYIETYLDKLVNWRFAQLNFDLEQRKDDE